MKYRIIDVLALLTEKELSCLEGIKPSVFCENLFDVAAIYLKKPPHFMLPEAFKDSWELSFWRSQQLLAVGEFSLALELLHNMSQQTGREAAGPLLNSLWIDFYVALFCFILKKGIPFILNENLDDLYSISALSRSFYKQDRAAVEGMVKNMQVSFSIVRGSFKVREIFLIYREQEAKGCPVSIQQMAQGPLGQMFLGKKFALFLYGKVVASSIQRYLEHNEKKL